MLSFFVSILLVLAVSLCYNIKLYRKVKRFESESRIDALTKLGNRRAFEECLVREIAVAARRADKVGLLFLDVNNFKGINDSFGHPIGDKALCLLADVLVASLRASDSAFRFGGDEFAVVVSSRPEEQGGLKIVADRIMSKLTDSLLNTKTDRVSISVSIGGAIYENNRVILCCLADNRLYAAKLLKSDGKSHAVFI